MSPEVNIADSDPGSNRNRPRPACPYCGFPRCWRHGSYRRKGFHRSLVDPSRELVAVQRSVCRHPSCERTFSVLPETVLPYCRFFLDGLLSIAGERAAGKSSYWIAKHRWGLSLRVVLRAVALIGRSGMVLEQMCREAVGQVAAGFATLVTAVRERCSWPAFTRRWFHGLYPCRAGQIFNPHKTGISR